MTILAKVKEKAGGVNELARALDVSHQAVSSWTRIPWHHVLTIEKLYGFKREQQRPDIYPPKAR